MDTIYYAQAPARADNDDRRPHHFVSVDGDHWHEVETDSWPPRQEDYAAIARLFKYKIRYVDGKQHRLGHITLATRYLRLYVAGVTFGRVA
jgi:hypothetical protein